MNGHGQRINTRFHDVLHSLKFLSTYSNWNETLLKYSTEFVRKFSLREKFTLQFKVYLHKNVRIEDRF